MSGRGSGVSLDFVIVGAQRAGSTYLNTCLHSHPDVFLCKDEVPFFEDPFFLTTPPSALQHVFARARPGQRLGIQRPDYLARPECAPRIRSLAPDARILAVLRDPVSRAVSAYFWYMQFGLLPMAPLDVGMGRLLAGWSDAAFPRAAEILTYGLYGSHLGRYFDVFGPERVLVLLSEELHDPSTFRGMYRFLGVDEEIALPVGERRTNTGVYDLRRIRVLRARRRMAWSWEGVTTYRYRPRRLRRPLRFLPVAAIVGFDRLVLARLLGSAPPALPADLETDLRAFYAGDVQLLEELLGRDLSRWRDNRPGTGARSSGPSTATKKPTGSGRA